VPIIQCPSCGEPTGIWKQPSLAVDCIITIKGTNKLVLIERRDPPLGLSLPGGFVEYGETVEEAVRREIAEEVNCELLGLEQFKVYSNPPRDPRHHTVAVVFTATTQSIPKAGDDAKTVHVLAPHWFPPQQMAFDHAQIIKDWQRSKQWMLDMP